MPRDCGEPGGELRRLVDRGQGLESQQQSVLSNVLRKLSSHNRLGGANNRGAVARRQLIESVEVSQYRLDDKYFVRLLDACLGHRLHFPAPARLHWYRDI